MSYKSEKGDANYHNTLFGSAVLNNKNKNNSNNKRFSSVFLLLLLFGISVSANTLKKYAKILSDSAKIYTIHKKYKNVVNGLQAETKNTKYS